jgi:molybdopterin-guanine dinucleotide biosynthesis protein A
MPALPTDLVARLTVALAHHSIAVARCEQRLQLAMLLTPAVLDSITQLLRKGDYRLMNWLEQQPCAVVDFSDASAFANINTADDLAALS